MAGSGLAFALNHMVAPHLGMRAFFSLARGLDVDTVEVRNDIGENSIGGDNGAPLVATIARDAGLRIASINGLQRFNRWSAERAIEARELIDLARQSGAAALVLVPANDGTRLAPDERKRDLEQALLALKPLLADAGVTGLVEPLGFSTCSLRLKQEAVDGIRAVQGEDVFRLVHDTFHHTVAGETETLPAFTGLVHISGVNQPLPTEALRDEHRVLVDAGDRIGNLRQIKALVAGGYAGRFSFEPFAKSVHDLTSPAAAIGVSMNFIEAHIMETAS